MRPRRTGIRINYCQLEKMSFSVRRHPSRLCDNQIEESTAALTHRALFYEYCHGARQRSELSGFHIDTTLGGQRELRQKIFLSVASACDLIMQL